MSWLFGLDARQRQKALEATRRMTLAAALQPPAPARAGLFAHQDEMTDDEFLRAVESQNNIKMDDYLQLDLPRYRALVAKRSADAKCSAARKAKAAASADRLRRLYQKSVNGRAE